MRHIHTHKHVHLLLHLEIEGCRWYGREIFFFTKATERGWMERRFSWTSPIAAEEVFIAETEIRKVLFIKF